MLTVYERDDKSVPKQSTNYGEVFEFNRAIYVRFEGGAILLSHAVERASDLCRPCIVTLDGREGFIPAKFGPDWWGTVTLDDVRRIAVF